MSQVAPHIPPPPPAPVSWWLLNDGQATGPYEQSDIWTAIRLGTLNGDALACPVKGQEWKALHQWPLFAATGGSSSAPCKAEPWNPVALGWLGLLFSPLWTGVMAAVNARRLGSPASMWKPLVIALGGLALYILSTPLFGSSYLLDLLLYLMTLGLIGWVELRPQGRIFQQRTMANETRAATWRWPILGGVPLALVVVLMMVVSPLMPPTPREVCQRLVDAKTVEQAKAQTTAKLWPILAVIYDNQKEGTPDGHVELTSEAEASNGMAGHLVGWRMIYESTNPPHVMEGVFQVVNYDGSWKVEEMYFTSVNNQTAASPVTLSSLPPATFTAALATDATPPDPSVAVASSSAQPSLAQVGENASLSVLKSQAAPGISRGIGVVTGKLAEHSVGEVAVQRGLSGEAENVASKLPALGSFVIKAVLATVAGIIALICKVISMFTGRRAAKPDAA